MSFIKTPMRRKHFFATQQEAIDKTSKSNDNTKLTKTATSYSDQYHTAVQTAQTYQSYKTRSI